MKYLKFITLTGFLAILMGYLLLYFLPIRKLHQPTSENTVTPHIFSTGILATNVEWQSEEELLVTFENTISIYNIDERSDEVMYEIDREGNSINMIPLPKSDHILIGDGIVCLTSINTIQNKEEVATVIDITSINEDLSKINSLSSSLTLLPLNCDDIIYLLPPRPILQDTIYYWDIGSEEIAPFYETFENVPIEEVKLEHGYVGVKSGGTIMIQKASSQYIEQEKDHYSVTARIDTWGISPFGHFVSITSGIIKIYNENEVVETINISAPNESFTNISISPGNTSFAVISSSGELWILQR